ncbi:MAG: putative baseplate assembly protein, partial [Methanothrix sp.]|nr:putative baseplate assembly protein [Methanothrix sp.]
MAWISEMQIYRLNRIGERSFKKFLKLLGSDLPEPASRARVDVTFSLVSGSDPVFVPKGTVLLAKDPDGSPLPFETQMDISVVGASIAGLFSTFGIGGKIRSDNTLANNTDHVYFLAFGQSPEEGDALYLGLDSSPRGKSLNLTFYLQDEPSRPGADDEDFRLYSSWSLVWEVSADGGSRWQKISVPPASDETKGLTYSGAIRLDVPDDPAISRSDLFKDIIKDVSKKSLFLIRCRIESIAGIEDGKQQKADIVSPKIDRILLNTAPALQGETVSCIVPVDPTEDGLPSMTLALQDLPIQDVFHLTTTSDGKEIEWTKVSDFDSSRPQDCSYIVDRARGKITFGDGLHGRIPSKGSSIRVIYCTGGGPKGNIPAGPEWMIKGELKDSIRARSFMAAEGGAAEETMEMAISRAREDLKRCRRAVTAEDYERLARETPGVRIKRAKAVPMYHPVHKESVFNTVTVIIVPESTSALPKPSSAILRTVHDHLDRRRLLTTEVFVYPPLYVKVSVKANVMPLVGQDPKEVVRRVEERIAKFLGPLKGGEDG